jgi:hypothetical protein
MAMRTPQFSAWNLEDALKSLPQGSTFGVMFNACQIPRAIIELKDQLRET